VTLRRTQAAGARCLLRRRALALLACTAGCAWGTARAAAADSTAPVLRIGPGQALKTPSAAAAVAPSGAVVEIEAGDYVGDVAVWTQERLTLRAVGGPVQLAAGGSAAEGKAIWVLRGGRFDIEGIHFTGARVAASNGAGIRLENGQLLVRHCRFTDNENGILTSNFRTVELDVQQCEFGHNGHGDGQSHNLYAGSIGRLAVTGSWFHHARRGHLIKSRAAHNEVRYSLLADGEGGQASYELEFPSGGVAIAVGNLIEQAATTQNPHLVSYGVEGLTWERNELFLVHNTLVDRRSDGGVFLRVAPGAGTLHCLNNLLLGKGVAGPALGEEAQGNFRVTPGDLVANKQGGLTLGPKAYARGRSVHPRVTGQADLAPTHQYAHPSAMVRLTPPARDPGAFQRLARARTGQPLTRP
jgi:hypothetical protein